MRYRPEIDGLRAVAVVPVILFHAGFTAIGGGYVGVDVFYVISGYLITSILLNDWAEGRFSIAAFYERRARRILPALIFVTALTLPFAYVLLQPADMIEFAKSIIAVATFSSNFFFWAQSGYFDTAAEMKPMLHTWSLAVEEQYYVLFPLLLMGLVRFGRRVQLLAIALLAIASLGLALAAIGDHPAAAFYLLPFRAWEILIGSLCAIQVFGRDLPFSGPSPAAVFAREALAAAGLAAILAACLSFDAATPAPSLYTLVPTVGASLVILFAGPGTLAGRLLSTPLFVGIGLLSYSAYLWHQPLLALARHRSLAELTLTEQVVLPLAAFALAFITYRYVETPWRKANVFRRDTVFRLAFAGSIAVIICGHAGVNTMGMPFRFAPQQVATDSYVRSLQDERNSIVRLGECQYNSDKTGVGIDDYLANWNCIDDPAYPGLARVPVAVAGDSHGADVVMAMKLNGLAPLQMTGAGCSLVPEAMTSDCRKMFAALMERIGGDPGIRYLVLANRMTLQELTPKAISSMGQFWRRFGKEVIVFTAMPEFANYRRKLMRGVEPKAELDLAKRSTSEAVRLALAGEGMRVVDTLALFCPLSGTCGYRAPEGDLLMVDDDHLSRTGATGFGRALLDGNPLFRNIATSGTLAEVSDLRGTR
jgi:peptidoglycan/LPS O-acetylase OafA/YrhL